MNPSYSTPHQPRPTLRTPARTGDAAASSAAPHARLSQRSATSLAALFAALLAFALVVTTAGPASAHDELVRTNPQAGAKLEKAPYRVWVLAGPAPQETPAGWQVTHT